MADATETIETSAVSLGEFGPAPRFTAAILGRTIQMKDATCPALHAAMQAAESGQHRLAAVRLAVQRDPVHGDPQHGPAAHQRAPGGVEDPTAYGWYDHLPHMVL